MQILPSIFEVQKFIRNQRKNALEIGFVPTMGALHNGHLSLLDRCKKENDISVCSIFVNPTQFNNPNDLRNYPRTIEEDVEKLEKVGVDMVFMPSIEEMYPKERTLNFNFGYLELIMEGKFRPGHFNGVAVVVSKLFNIVQPDKAYFGRKDLQQFAIINKLVEELNFPIKLTCADTIREADGLAMSSRNLLLENSMRQQAIVIYNTLNSAKQALLEKSTVEDVIKMAKGAFSKSKLELEYFEIVNTNTLKPVENIGFENTVSICAAAYAGKVRLIDNILVF